MPTHADPVALVVAGRTYAHWSRYMTASHLLEPADAFELALHAAESESWPTGLEPGATAELRVGDDTVLYGVIDDVESSTSRGERTLAVTGRDLAGQLVDCSAEMFAARDLSLAEVVAQYVRPLGIVRHEIRGGKPRRNVHIQPGETVWDALQAVAEANGLWPWFSPDGTLVVGGPDYRAAPVARLVERPDGFGNNCLSVRVTRSAASRYSQVTILGQTPGSNIEGGMGDIRAVARDTGVARKRHRIEVDPALEDLQTAQRIASKRIADARLDALRAEIVVAGHRTPSGVLWMPGQRVELDLPIHGLSGIFFLLGRTFSGGRDGGRRTSLVFVESGTWLPELARVSAKAEDTFVLAGPSKPAGDGQPVAGDLVEGDAVSQLLDYASWLVGGGRPS